MSTTTTVKPSSENVTLFPDWQRSTPAQFALQENPVLYGGDRQWSLSTNTEIYSNITNTSMKATIDIFVLDTSLVVWFTEYDIGVEHKYTDVILHAKQNDALYLQIKTDKDSATVNEVWLTPPKENIPDLKHDPLFKYFYTNIGTTNKLDRLSRLQSLFNNITKCSSLHFDPDSENEENDNGISTEDEGKESGKDYIMLEQENDLEVVNEGEADDICEVDEEGGVENSAPVSSTSVVLDNKRQRHEFDIEDEIESANSGSNKRR